MKKSLPLILGALIMLSMVSAYAQEDVFSVNDPALENRMRPQVWLPHDAHNEKAGIDSCNTCHHVYENGRIIEDEDSAGTPCSDCHYDEKKNNRTDLIRIYHLRCKGCHMKKKAGPVMCGECHRKEGTSLP